jgi:hypothetical protein
MAVSSADRMVEHLAALKAGTKVASMVATSAADSVDRWANLWAALLEILTVEHSAAQMAAK